MVAWHIPLAISGQQADLPRGLLSFAPKVQPPYTLPVFMPGVMGTLSATPAGQFTLALTVGELSLTELSVAGHAAPTSGGTVRVAVGEPVTW